MKKIITILVSFKLLLIPNGVPFNIDWKHPVIIQNRGGINHRVPNYFGAKVNLLTTDEGSAWILIGAPKANSTLASQRDVLEPGVIWQCSIGRTPTDICRVLVMDSEGNKETGQFHELKDGEWFGGPEGIALSSTNVVGCGPVWEKRDVLKSESFIHGACYSRPRSDLFQQSLPPPTNIPLVPLDDPEVLKGNTMQKKFGLAGFSVHLPKTGNEIVMGAPGFLKWRGALIQYMSSDGGSTFSKRFVSDPVKYQDKITPFNFLGYSLTSGHIFKEDPIQYVAGAPRGDNLNGKVVIFRFPDRKEEPLTILKEIEGDQTGSYFGSSVLAVDVNGDGWDDLLVGAPRFSRGMRRAKFQILGRSGKPLLPEAYKVGGGFERFKGYGDEGAVYLYLSKNGNSLYTEEQLLIGGNRPSGQFGTALTSIGDINRDGVNDFAISAPFEDSSGAVYIYHGSRSGIITAPSQIIRAKEINQELKGFGISLGGNVDIDRNGIPDIAVGSFNSSQVVILRSKPLINVYGSLRSSQKNLPMDTEAFQITSCLSYDGDYAPNTIKLDIGLQSDSNSRTARVSLQFADWNQPGAIKVEGGGSSELFKASTINYEVNAIKGEEICTVFHAIVISPLESSGAPVTFQQNISIPDESSFQVKARFLSITPDGDTTTSGESFSSFCKTCPMTSNGLPAQSELSLPLAVPCGDDGICQSDLKLEFNFPNVIPDKGFVIGSSSSFTMEIVLRNEGETAIAPAVIVSWWRLKHKRIPGDCSMQREIHNQITYKCQLGQLLEMDKVVTLSLEFDMSNLVVSEIQSMSQLIFNVTATTASWLPGVVSDIVTVPLSADADLHIEGSRYLEPFNMEMKAPYVVFKHEFEIGMDGPSPVGNFEVFFQLPVNLTTHTEGNVVNVRGVNHDEQFQCQPTKGQFANTGLVIGGSDVVEEDPDFEGAGIRVPILKDKDVSRESNSSFVEKGHLLIHCDSPFVACIEVTCKVGEYRPGKVSLVSFVMDIEANLIRSLMKTHKADGVKVESKGMLILPDVVKKIQPTLNNKPDETIAITIIEKEGYKPVSKWIYTLAVVIGLIILACVAFCLYSCGCFENKKKKQDDVVDAAEMEPLKEDEKEKVLEVITEEEISEENNSNSGTKSANDAADPGRTPVSLLEPPDFVPPEPQPSPIPGEREEKNQQDEQEEEAAQHEH